MPKCSYCGEIYDVHKGLTLVKNDGNIIYLCSSKCRKNMAMKRRKTIWISKKKKIKGRPEKAPVETKEEIVQDIEGPTKSVPEKTAEKEEKIAEKQADENSENSKKKKKAENKKKPEKSEKPKEEPEKTQSKKKPKK